MTANNNQKFSKALEGVRALRDRLSSKSEAFSNAVRETEAFCQVVRQELRARRKALGVEQKDIAERMDISQPAVSKIENGEGDIGLKSIARYASAIGLKPVILFIPTAQVILTEATETAEEWLLHEGEALLRGGALKDMGRPRHVGKESFREGKIMWVEASDTLRSAASFVEDVQISVIHEISDGVQKKTREKLSQFVAHVIAEDAKKVEA